MRHEALIGSVDEILKETGLGGIKDFPKLYTASTAEDRRLEAALMMYSQRPDETAEERLAEELASYIELDDINLGLAARAAEALMKDTE